MDIISKLKIGNTIYDVGLHIDVSTFAKVAATLSIPPGTSTLTNGTEAYVPGDIVRVVDQNADSGYVFYRLHAINNGQATWSKLDEGSPNIPEIVTVQFLTNVSDTDDLVNVATATATFLGQSFTKTYSGEDVLFEIPVDTEYTITYGNVSNYTTPSSYTRTSVYGARPIINAQYSTCELNISVSCDKENIDGLTVNVIVDDISYPFAIQNLALDVLTLRFTPATGNHTLTLQDKTGYIVSGDKSVSKAAGDNYPHLSYIHGYLGVSVYTNTGDVYSIESWNSNNNADAIGLAVITEDSKFVIKKDSYYMPSYIRFVSASGYSVNWTPNNSYDGAANSSAIYSTGGTASATGAYLGRYCAMVDANKVTIANQDVYTYIGAIDEIVAYLDNYKDIIDAYTITGIDCRGGFSDNYTPRIASSTQSSSTKIYVAYTSTGCTNISNGTSYTVTTDSYSKYSSTNNSSYRLTAVPFLPYI